MNNRRKAATVNNASGFRRQYFRAWPFKRPAAVSVLNASLVLWLFLLLAAPSDLRAADELDFGLSEVRLDHVEIRGNQALKTDELKSVLDFHERTWLRPLSESSYRPHQIETRLRLLQKFYQRQGFHQAIVRLDSVVSDSAEEGDVIYISVDEGSQTIVSRVSFQGTQPFTEEELRRNLTIVEGTPAPGDLNALGGEVYALDSFFRDNAYLAATVQPLLTCVAVSDSTHGGAFIDYLVDAGPCFRVGKIDVAGATATREHLIYRELKIAEGDEFSWHRIEESRRNLLGTVLFRDVGFEPLGIDTVAGMADLLIRVVERQPAFYELGAGIGSQQLVRLIAGWGHNNLWGTGHRLQLSGKIYWNKEEILGADPEKGANPEINYRTDLYYVNPHVAKTRFPLELNLFSERVTRGESAMNLQTQGLSVGTAWGDRRRLDNRFAFQVEEDDPQRHPAVTDSSLIVRFNEDIWKSQTRSLVYSVNADRRDNPFRPTRGRLYTGQLRFAGGPLEGDNSFVRCQLGWHGYTVMPLGGILAFRASVGGVWPFGDSADAGADGVPYADRFFAGGVSTVRGYLEGSLGPQITDPDAAWAQQVMSDSPIYAEPARGGNYSLLTNIEWRIPLVDLRGWDFGGVLFVDGGNVWEDTGDILLSGFRLRSWPREPGQPGATRISDYRYSVGTGLRLDTPFGPFRLDVGFPLKRALYISEDDDVRTEDDKVMYHFTLGYPF